MGNLNYLVSSLEAKEEWGENNNYSAVSSEAQWLNIGAEEELSALLDYNGSGSSRLEAGSTYNLLTHYGVQETTQLGEDVDIDISDLLSPVEPPLGSEPMRHSPFTTSSTAPTSSATHLQSYYGAQEIHANRPVFTRSQSVPEQYLLDSADEELLLEAAAATLDDPLPITPSVVLNQARLSSKSSAYLSNLHAPRYYRPVDHIAAANTTSRAFSRLSLSSDLPTSRHSAAAQDRLSLLQAELQAAAYASRRLTGNKPTRRHRLEQPIKLSSSAPLTLGRSLQLVTERHTQQLAAAAAAAAVANANKTAAANAKNVRFNSEEWRLAHRDLLNDTSLFPSGLGIDADAWMSVEDVRSGRWARWDALVKQESQDSQTRDSGIETGSCFTSSEDSNRGSTNDYHHLHHHYYHKKVQHKCLLPAHFLVLQLT